MVKNEQERKLVARYAKADQQLEAAKLMVKEAQKVFDAAEHELIVFLEDRGASATKTYAGLGYVQINKPRVCARCNVENLSQLKAYLNAIGREDIIKETANAATLSSFVGELLEEGKPVPECIGYYLKPQVRLYGQGE